VPKAKGRAIVVDASVAGRAGSLPSSSGSSPCRSALEAIDEAEHRAVFSRESLDEWKRHGFARGWFTHMVAARRIELLGEVRNDRLRAKLLPCASSESKRKAMDKDAHLLEAALQADRIVISCDEIVRALFQEACSTVQEIRAIHWANPEIESEEVVPWIRDGARAEAKRRLSSR